LQTTTFPKRNSLKDKPSQRHLSLLVLFLSALLLGSCASLSTRFSTPVATGFARDDMWKLTTPDSEIYYPKQYEAEALRIAKQMNECLLAFRSKARGNTPTRRMLVYLTSTNFNNAYVSPEFAGEPLHTVNPLFLTSETFHWYNMSGGDVSEVVCHEVFHYVHLEQTRGLWRFINLVFGPQVSPQSSLERWFTEGVAQFYEGHLRHPVGRPHSPYYHALFYSGVAARKGKIREGDLHIQVRELLPASGAYLTSLFFIEYLVEQYGEAKLWEVISLQADALFFPFGVSSRFQKVYGKSLAKLFAEWRKTLAPFAVPPPKPPGQTSLLKEVGFSARLGVALDGSMAVVRAHLEKIPDLLLLNSDGSQRARLSLTQYIPYRQWISASSSSISGLSFSADGRWLFLHNRDINNWGDQVGQLWKVDAHTAEVVQVWQDAGDQGGALHPDGDRYLWVEFEPGTTRLVEFHLHTQKKQTLFEEGPGISFAAPAYSPDGKQVAFARWEGKGWDIRLCQIGGACTQLTEDAAFNYAPKWIDNDNLLFVRKDEKTAQVFRFHLPSQKRLRLTQVPFLAMDPGPSRSHISFLNREGWDWSVDRIELHLEELDEETPSSPSVSTSSAFNALRILSDEHDEALKIESNKPYSGWEDLWLPRARIPFVDFYFPAQSGDGKIGFSLGLSLFGNDRLNFHNWSMDFRFASPAKTYNASLAYINRQLAPWTLFARLQHDNYPYLQYWAGQLSGQRAFFTTPLQFSFLALNRKYLGVHQRYLGPSISVDYAAGAATAMGGTQTLFQIGAAGNFFFKDIGSTRDVVSLSGYMSVAIPLPFLTRHSFVLNTRGHSLLNAPKGTLQLGGIALNPLFLQSEESQHAPSPGVFLPRFFGEAVRGFEDFSIRANHAGIANARYRYSFVIDRGSISTFKIFPSFFWRQVDVEVFGAAAVSDNATQPWLRSAGGAVFLRTSISQTISMSLYYQLSFRMDARLPPLHLIGYSLE